MPNAAYASSCTSTLNLQYVLQGGIPPDPPPTTAANGDCNVLSAGNTMAEANTNLGREVIAATSEGARAVAGSGVSDILDNPSAHPASSGNSHSFKARHIDNRGSHAFTDIAGTSSAIVGPGNGPAALAYGNEVAAFARSHRTSGLLGGPQDGFNQ